MKLNSFALLAAVAATTVSEPAALWYSSQQAGHSFQVVPEPGAYALAGRALALLAMARRRR